MAEDATTALELNVLKEELGRLNRNLETLNDNAIHRAETCPMRDRVSGIEGRLIEYEKVFRQVSRTMTEVETTVRSLAESDIDQEKRLRVVERRSWKTIGVGSAIIVFVAVVNVLATWFKTS